MSKIIERMSLAAAVLLCAGAFSLTGSDRGTIGCADPSNAATGGGTAFVASNGGTGGGTAFDPSNGRTGAGTASSNGPTGAGTAPSGGQHGSGAGNG